RSVTRSLCFAIGLQGAAPSTGSSTSVRSTTRRSSWWSATPSGAGDGPSRSLPITWATRLCAFTSAPPRPSPQVPRAVVVRGWRSGIVRASGGAFEREMLHRWSFAADGLLTRIEWFDLSDETEALARFDELTAERPAPRIENAATRSVDRFEEAWEARDWD